MIREIRERKNIFLISTPLPMRIELPIHISVSTHILERRMSNQLCSFKKPIKEALFIGLLGQRQTNFSRGYGLLQSSLHPKHYPPEGSPPVEQESL